MRLEEFCPSLVLFPRRGQFKYPHRLIYMMITLNDCSL